MQYYIIFSKFLFTKILSYYCQHTERELASNFTS